MNVLNDSFSNVIRENEDYELFCEKYKSAHDNLISDLKTYSETLEPSILVPVCSRIFMRGKLIHTNEVMVSLGCGYFTKCTSSEAQQICLRRIKRADTILQELDKERNFVESRMKFSQDNVFATDLQEIIEPYNEATENTWRDEHARRMKKHRKKENQEGVDVDHEEIMNKLELLELQEEIEGLHVNEKKSIVEPPTKADHSKKKADFKKPNVSKIMKEDDNEESREFMLRKKLADLRQRKKNKCSTEEDIFRRLNELEEEEEIEDELDRLYDNIYGGQEEDRETGSDKSSEEESEDDYYSDSSEEENKPKSQDADKSAVKTRKVSFAGQIASDAKTATINFSHSDNEEIEKNDTTVSITSPSDIYKSFPENFKKETKSILKNIHKVKEEVHNDLSSDTEHATVEQPRRIDTRTQQIILGNIVEHSKDVNESIADNSSADQKRPVSKFKSMRNAKKQSK